MKKIITLCTCLLLLTSPAKAIMSLTFDITDGSWNADITDDLYVSDFFSLRLSTWRNNSIGGTQAYNYSATMDYSGNYGLDPVSGSGVFRSPQPTPVAGKSIASPSL